MSLLLLLMLSRIKTRYDERKEIADDVRVEVVNASSVGRKSAHYLDSVQRADRTLAPMFVKEAELQKVTGLQKMECLKDKSSFPRQLSPPGCRLFPTGKLQAT